MGGDRNVELLLLVPHVAQISTEGLQLVFPCAGLEKLLTGRSRNRLKEKYANWADISSRDISVLIKSNTHSLLISAFFSLLQKVINDMYFKNRNM